MPQPFSILDALIAAGFRSGAGKLEITPPVAVSARTIQPAFGFSFEFGLELIAKHGRAPRQIGAGKRGKRVILVADLLHAIEAESAARAANQAPLTEAEEAAERLRMRGYEVRQ